MAMVDPNTPAVSGVMEFMQVVVPVVWSAVGLILIALMAYLFRAYAKTKVWSDLMEALEQSVDTIQGRYVDWWKAASADGKLTKDERAAAVKLAWGHCLGTIKDPRLMSFAANLGWDTISSLIKRLVDKKKPINAAVVAVVKSATPTIGVRSCERRDDTVPTRLGNAGHQSPVVPGGQA